jgi:flagellar biogenesis protein FliO
MKMRSWLCVFLFMAVSVVAHCSAVAAEEGPPRSWTTSSADAGAESFSAQSSVLRMVGGLFLCFGMLGFGVHLYKRFVLPRALSAQRRMQVVERIQLSQKSSLVLVKLDGKEFLMATGPEASRLISLSDKRQELFEDTLSSAYSEVGEYNV